MTRGFAIYLLIGVILNGAAIVYDAFSHEPEPEPLAVSLARLRSFLLGVLFWPGLWFVSIKDIITGRSD